MITRALLLTWLLTLNNLCLSAAAETEVTPASGAVVAGVVVAEQPDTEVSDPAAESTTANIKDSAFAGHDLSPWGMYQAADVVVKTVMIGLLVASLLTWAVWLFKTVQLKSARRKSTRLLQQLTQAGSFAQALTTTGSDKQYGNSLLLVQATQHELNLSAAGPTSDDGLKERVAARLERVQASLTSAMNQGTGILATIGSVAPFVGLFGTVWGIMNSFIGIAQTQTTNLAVVAPGIAEALLATAIGLVAAIPAVVIYNHFSRAIAVYRAQQADIVTAVLILISRDLDRDHPQARTLNAELNSLQEAG
ncbi:tonB-system energizer ExbB [Bacterioplanoides sp. SCSIO 12839]|uniref:tonB-system energizer ExbB n=1 Tax=Bacterioplanoides sp. SCSIO 12839 TaxID=2829569 RepID=UPI002104C088|nr:tonB-system energizer ExbB [Bacterioplanoides sp. SCSIO 12839]